jgi:hypothetical protein
MLYIYIYICINNGYRMVGGVSGYKSHQWENKYQIGEHKNIEILWN